MFTFINRYFVTNLKRFTGFFGGTKEVESSVEQDSVFERSHPDLNYGVKVFSGKDPFGELSAWLKENSDLIVTGTDQGATNWGPSCRPQYARFRCVYTADGGKAQWGWFRLQSFFPKKDIDMFTRMHTRICVIDIEEFSDEGERKLRVFFCERHSALWIRDTPPPARRRYRDPLPDGEVYDDLYRDEM